MQYFGGKNRSGKKIANIINDIITTNNIKSYVELFVGSGGVFRHVNCENKIINDKESLIIELHKYLADGNKVSLEYDDYYKLEDLYKELKNGKYGDIPIGVVGYIAYQCSFAGKRFGGFARKRNGTRDYFKNGLSSLLTKEAYVNTAILNKDYKEVEFPKNSLVYLDPPYQNTIKYTVSFDYDRFEEYLENISKDNIVLISECSVLKNTSIFHKFDFTRGVKRGEKLQGKRVEELILIHNDSIIIK